MEVPTILQWVGKWIQDMEVETMNVNYFSQNINLARKEKLKWLLKRAYGQESLLFRREMQLIRGSDEE